MTETFFPKLRRDNRVGSKANYDKYEQEETRGKGIVGAVVRNEEERAERGEKRI